MMPLGLLSIGEAGEIVAIRPGLGSGSGSGSQSEKCDTRIEDLGLRVGRTVEMLNNAGSPVLLKVGESRVAVDRSIAMKIMIKGAAR